MGMSRDGDARAPLELDGLEAVADGEDDPAAGVGVPPGAQAAPGLDRPLGAVLDVDRATPGRRVAGVEGERPLLLEARDQLGATGHSRVTSDLRGERGGIRRGNQMREKLSLLSFWGLIFR